MHKLSTIGLGIILWLTSSNGLSAAEPAATLDAYLKHVQSTLIRLEDKTTPADERLRARSALVNGSHYWLPVRGKPGRALPVVSLFQRKTPSGWRFLPAAVNDDSAVVNVHFKVMSFANHPWQTAFEMAFVNDRWQITSFEDITRRPVVPGANIEAVVDAYFKDVKSAVSRIYSGELSKEEKQSLTMEFGFGAGYWVGQMQNLDMPAGTMFTYFLTARPDSWEIEQSRIAGDYGETIVHFSSTPRHTDPVIKTYTLELSQVKGQWYLSRHRTAQPAIAKEETVNIAAIDPSGKAPLEMVQSQLDLLSKPGIQMSQLVEASEPLWVDARKSRSGLGRLVAMVFGLSGADNQPPTWTIIDSQVGDIEARATALANWPDPALQMPFEKVQFSLKKSAQGWRLFDAQLLR
ncbi:MAG: hypothetical protein HOC23_16010 [Halieaceae bacterium]|nr:hypothetical protein [Halieaceae bacterium]